MYFTSIPFTLWYMTDTASTMSTAAIVMDARNTLSKQRKQNRRKKKNAHRSSPLDPPHKPTTTVMRLSNLTSPLWSTASHATTADR